MSFPIATEEENQNEPGTAYFLVLSGGAFRGAVQFWVIVHLMRLYALRHVSGVSVGSINGAMASQLKLKELLAFWEEVDGLKGFFNVRWSYLLLLPVVFVLRDIFGAKHPWLVAGVLDGAPLFKKLRSFLKLADVKIPFTAGVVSADTGNYYNLNTKQMKTDRRFALAVLTSSIMAGIMKPTQIALEPDKGKEMGWDGGFRNIFPVPWAQIARARAEGHRVVVHAVGCMPRKRVESRKPEELMSELAMLGRIIELFEAETYEGDFTQLREAVGADGEVRLWLPQHPDDLNDSASEEERARLLVGPSFDASAATIQRRLEIGKSTVARGPVVLPGLDPGPQEG